MGMFVDLLPRLWQGQKHGFCSHLTNATSVVISTNCHEVCSVQVQIGSVGTLWTVQKCVSVLSHEFSVVRTHDSSGLIGLVMSHEATHFDIVFKVAVVSLQTAGMSPDSFPNQCRSSEKTRICSIFIRNETNMFFYWRVSVIFFFIDNRIFAKSVLGIALP